MDYWDGTNVQSEGILRDEWSVSGQSSERGEPFAECVGDISDISELGNRVN